MRPVGPTRFAMSTVQPPLPARTSVKAESLIILEQQPAGRQAGTQDHQKRGDDGNVRPTREIR